jgi:hypothetical protein
VVGIWCSRCPPFGVDFGGGIASVVASSQVRKRLRIIHCEADPGAADLIVVFARKFYNDLMNELSKRNEDCAEYFARNQTITIRQ